VFVYKQLSGPTIPFLFAIANLVGAFIRGYFLIHYYFLVREFLLYEDFSLKACAVISLIE